MKEDTSSALWPQAFISSPEHCPIGPCLFLPWGLFPWWRLPAGSGVVVTSARDSHVGVCHDFEKSLCV